MSSFPSNIVLLSDGEPVEAGVPNRPLMTLDQRTTYLKQLLDAAGIGSTLFARGVTVDPGVNVGQPVYFNPGLGYFSQGLAATTTDPITQAPVVSDSAHIWGVVFSKASADQADLLLAGFSALDLSAALEPGQVLSAGLYYLSRSTPGALTRVRPPVAIPVLRSDGSGNVYVNPAWEDPLTNHIHLRRRLRAAPAGTHHDPGAGHLHVITDPDPFVPGWLPANHAVFKGLAPTRAVFGYNLGADHSLRAVWPPVPFSPVLLQDGVQVPDDNEGLVIFDRNGIWWTSARYGEAPFPDNIHTDPQIISEWSQASETAPGYEYHMSLDLYFTQFAFMTDQTVVTSLQTEDKRIKITCATDLDKPGATGALDISLELTFLVGADDTPGYLAFKEFNPITGTFSRGPVTSGVYSSSNNVLMTGSASATRTIDNVDRTVFVGDVGIAVTESINRELFVELVRLDGVREEYAQNVMYLGFLPGRQSALRSRLTIPETLDLTAPLLFFKLRLIGFGAGVLPPLTLTYRRIVKPAALNTPTALLLTDTALALTITASLTGTQQYVDVISAPFAVAAGDDILFTLQRAGDDAYPYEVGVLRQAGLITQ